MPSNSTELLIERLYVSDDIGLRPRSGRQVEHVHGFRIAHPTRPAIRRIVGRDRADEIFFGLDSDDFWRDDRLSRRRHGSTIGNFWDPDDQSPRQGAAEADVISICRQSPTNRFVGELCFPSENATMQESQSGFCLRLM